MVEIEGAYEIAADPKLVWEMVLDPDVLARVMPGCEKLERINDNEYKGKMRIKVGPVDGVYQGKLTLSELRSEESFHLAVKGRGASGNIRGEGDVKLEPTGSGGTLLRYEGQGEVSGRMATVGQRLTQSSASAITKQCLQNLDRQIAARVEPQQAGDVSVAEGVPLQRKPVVPAAPSQTEFAMGVAQELLDEYIPDANQRRLLLGFAVGSLVLLLMNWFANTIARRVVKKLQEDHELHKV
jgi:carbon monoxide dehydrogenase subunit G